MFPSFTEAIKAVHYTMSRERGDLVGRLNEIAPGAGGSLKILDYFTSNLDVNMYPCAMLRHESRVNEWEGLDTGSGPEARSDFVMVASLLSHGYKDFVNDDLVGAMEAHFSEALNSRHRHFDYGGRTWFYNEVMPVSSAQYGVLPITANGTVFVQSCDLTITISTIYHVPQRT